MSYTVNLSAQALARGVYVLSGAAVFVLLARLLGPAALGEYVYATNIVNVLAALADLGSTGILARDLVASGERRGVYLANFLVLRVLLGALIAVPALGVAAWIAAPGLALPLGACCLLLPLVAARFFDPIFQIAGRAWLSLLLAATYGAAVILGSLAAALLTSHPVSWAVCAYVGSGAAYGAAGLLLADRLIRPRLREASRRGMAEILSSAGPYCLGSLFAMLTARLDIFILAALGTAAMVAQYNAAFRFIDLGMAVAVTVLTPLVTVFTAIASADRRALNRALDAMLRFVATWTIAVAVLAPGATPLVVRALYGAAYAPAAPVLDVLAWKFMLAFVNLLMFAALMTIASIRFTWWNSALALAVNLACNFALVPLLGIMGAAFASLAGELVQTAIDFLFLRAALGRVMEPRWLGRLAVAGAAASAVLHLPLALDRAWLLAPAALTFLAVLRLSGAFPGNPLRSVEDESRMAAAPRS